MANKKTPEIRFESYSCDWSTTPLRTYLTTSSNKNKDNAFSKEDVLSVSKENGVVNQIEYQGKSLAGASLTGYSIIGTNEIVYTKSPLRDQPFGIIKTNTGLPDIVSALYAVYTPLENVEPSFVQAYFDSEDRLNDYLRPIVRKGAKNTLNIGNEDALAGDVSFPQKDEQKDIVELFNEIDSLIALNEAKLEKLRQLKSALLDKMFV